MVKTIVIALLLAATTAHAEPADEVIATQPIALATRGMSLSYERHATPRLSWVALTGVRLGALGDYDASTVTVGGELRVWLRGSTPMRGPYLAAHVSAGRTSVTDQMSRDVGTSWAFTERVDIGWRWRLPLSLTLAPSLGIGAIEDVSGSGRLAPMGRPTFSIGLELGWWRPR